MFENYGRPDLRDLLVLAFQLSVTVTLSPSIRCAGSGNTHYSTSPVCLRKHRRCVSPASDMRSFCDLEAAVGKGVCVYRTAVPDSRNILLSLDIVSVGSEIRIWPLEVAWEPCEFEGAVASSPALHSCCGVAEPRTCTVCL